MTLKRLICESSNNTWNSEQWFMKHLVQNVIHDNKLFDDISFLEFVVCQCSNNAWKCEQYFVKDLVKNKIFDNKCLDDIILL